MNQLLLELNKCMSLENPHPHPLTCDPPDHSVLSFHFVVMLTAPLLGWLCPKGQVTRAQEAEENYLVKRELATVKQQSEDFAAQLEQAKNTIGQLQQQQQQPHAVRRATASPAGRSHWLGDAERPVTHAGVVRDRVFMLTS